MADLEHIHDHMAIACKECGSVNFALLRSGKIECNACGDNLHCTWKFETTIDGATLKLKARHDHDDSK